MTFPSAVALNNTAVSFLCNDDSETAMELIKSAWISLDEQRPPNEDQQVDDVPDRSRRQGPPHLIPPSPLGSPCASRCSSPILTAQPTNDEASIAPAMVAFAETYRVVVVHSVRVDTPSLNEDDESEKVSPNNSFYIFKRAFVFDFYGREMNRLFWLHCVPHIPAVILFNAGLIFHRVAAKNGSSLVFLKALEMYQLSKSFVDCNARIGLYVSELDLLMLALANNMGHCYSHFNNVDESRNCLERMLALFIFSSSTILLTKEEYDFYHVSLLFGVCQKPVVSPAA